jgi:hypothetical protein
LFLGRAAFLTAHRLVVKPLGVMELLLFDRKDEISFAIATDEGLVGKSAFVSVGGNVFAGSALLLRTLYDFFRGGDRLGLRARFRITHGIYLLLNLVNNERPKAVRKKE